MKKRRQNASSSNKSIAEKIRDIPGVLFFNFSLDQGVTPERNNKPTERDVETSLWKTINICVIGKDLFETIFEWTFLFIDKPLKICFGGPSLMLCLSLSIIRNLYLYAFITNVTKLNLLKVFDQKKFLLARDFCEVLSVFSIPFLQVF